MNLSTSEHCQTTNTSRLCAQTKLAQAVYRANSDALALLDSGLEVPMAPSYKSRPVRAIDFLGSVLKFCCSVATQKDISAVHLSQEELQNHVRDIQSSIGSDHSDLIQVTEEMSNFSNSVKQTFGTLHSAVNNISAMFSTFSDSLNGLEFEVSGFFELQLGGLAQTSSLLSLLRRQHIRESCYSKRISEQFIAPSQLAIQLKMLEGKLLRDGYRLAVPSVRILEYYRLPIAECAFSDRELVVKLRVPIKAGDLNWKLYKFHPVFFAHENFTCNIHHEPMFLAKSSKGDIRTVSGFALEHCNPPLTDLCYLPRLSADLSPFSSCIEHVFSNAPVSELNDHCVFRCQDLNKQIVVRSVGVGQYAVTHMVGEAEVFDFKSGVSHKFIAPLVSGSLLLVMPCHHELRQNGVVIIDRDYPCSAMEHPFSVHIAIPAAWSTISSLQLQHSDFTRAPVFKNYSQVYLANWTLALPNFKVLSHAVRVSVNNKQEPHLIYVGNWAVSWGEILLSIWLVLLTIFLCRDLWSRAPAKDSSSDRTFPFIPATNFNFTVPTALPRKVTVTDATDEQI